MPSPKMDCILSLIQWAPRLTKQNSVIELRTVSFYSQSPCNSKGERVASVGQFNRECSRERYLTIVCHCRSEGSIHLLRSLLSDS